MEQSIAQQNELRLQRLFDDCQQQVIAQIIGPFGLSPAMFQDRSGGNVTTVHNFENASADFVATKDHASYEQSREKYDREKIKDIRARVKRELKATGIDGYTGQEVDPLKLEADHVTSLKKINATKKNHLAFNTGEGYGRLSDVANSPENLVATHRDINNPKRAKDIIEFANEVVDGQTNAERLGLDIEKAQVAKQRSEEHLARTADSAILRKQAGELLSTGAAQAARMGVRQALGVLLNELVNGLFNEIKVLIKHGVELGKTLFEDIRARLMRVVEVVAEKIPAATAQLFEGGVSGFMSNLLTFMINGFLSTAKRFVTVVREGLIGLYKAFKLIMFPPKGMSADDALKEGLKLLSAVVVSSVGILLQETVTTFIATVPFLMPVADVLSSVLIGTFAGLLSAFIAYQIDSFFAGQQYDEKLMDELMANAKRSDEFVRSLTELSETSLSNVSRYTEAISGYQGIGRTLGVAGVSARATLLSLERTAEDTRKHVADSVAMIEYIESSQRDIEAFLEKFYGEKYPDRQS
ncbi:hypothetical protein [Achromobacter sp. NFACC18-2]|uniref:hypothetical protein n=1 Tax=Achromobacter sp. NFACC18-2 TaxID=1564112 RepID=UPI0008CECF93|nr:hypothetical protein [Achromobacter sp. NFACC18-2]SEK12572.1 hypothetical protein SAMN03159494_05674 [Achromobacter sp. NFACC18-2]